MLFVDLEARNGFSKRNKLVANSSLRNGLSVAFVPGIDRNLVGPPLTRSGVVGQSVNKEGQAYFSSSSGYIDFGAVYSPSSVGATAVVVTQVGSILNSFVFSNGAASGQAGIEILVGAGGVAGVVAARVGVSPLSSGTISLSADERTVPVTLGCRYIPLDTISIYVGNITRVKSQTGAPGTSNGNQNLRLFSRGATYYTQPVNLFLYWNRPLFNAELDSVLRNPWQIFERRIWVPVAAAAPAPTSLAPRRAFPRPILLH